MPSEQTFFLKPVEPVTGLTPNYVNATGTTSFFNVSQGSKASETNAQTQTLVNGGVAVAIANSQALFLQDPDFAFLGTDTEVLGEAGTYLGTAKSQASVVSTYEITSKKPFSFEFAANLYLESKEIENPKSEYSQAQLNISFLILDITNLGAPKVLDYFSLDGNLISSQGKGNVSWKSSCHVTLTSKTKVKNINGNDGLDFVQADVFGQYSRRLKVGTQLAIVKLEKNFTLAQGDALIGQLGKDVIYGTLGQDRLTAKPKGSKIYASYGNDTLLGRQGDDILEGGEGDDLLKGDRGHDRLSGGNGNDTLVGGLGNDAMVGGDGVDTFIFKRFDSLRHGEYDVVEDFQVGVDRLKFLNWGKQIGQISQTQAGALLTSRDQGQLLFKGVSALDLQSAIGASYAPIIA